MPSLVGVGGFRLGLRLVQVLCQMMPCGMRRCSGFLKGSGLVCIVVRVSWVWSWCRGQG